METQEDHLLRVLNMSMMCNLEKKKEKDFLKHVVGTNIEMNNNIETEADTTVPSFGGGGGKA